MDGCGDIYKRTGELSPQELTARYKNAIRNMVLFRHDKRLYVFWRNVYKHYRDAVWQLQ